MTWRIVLTPWVRKQLDALEDRHVRRVADRLRQVALDPFAASNVKALRGGGFRLRVGDLRVLYDLLDDELVVLVVENRAPPGNLPQPLKRPVRAFIAPRTSRTRP